LQPHCFRAATIFPSRSSTTKQRLYSSVNEQRLRSTATATASSAYDSQRSAAARHYDKQREQTSAETVDCFQLSLIA
jgi:hypothetical protein